MSDKYVINGGKLLKGEITVKGAKNHALKMLPTAILSDQPCQLSNVPDILDIATMSSIIESIGGQIQRNKDQLSINPKNINSSHLPAELVTKMRASFLFIIPLLHKFGEVIFPHPGGDAIGQRPIDMILDFLRKMGANVIESPEAYKITAKKLKGINFTFKWITHTGTEALIMAAVLAEGQTIIKNAAMEPEIVALGEYLNKVGAKITGLGTSTITIEGVKRLEGGQCQIIPDRIEAGTFAIMGALCGDPIKVNGIDSNHLDILWKYFDLMNINYHLEETAITISKAKNILPQHIKTHEYPGFATDLQPPMTLLLTQAQGLSMMHETVYEGRLFYTDKLNKMGAKIIMADPHRVLIEGPTPLYGKRIGSPDVRAGITLILGALIANGISEIDNIHHIKRGYEQLDKRLQNLGANIKEEKDCDH